MPASTFGIDGQQIYLVDEGSATNPVGRTHPRLSGQLVGLENNRALPPRRTIWLASLI